MDNATGVQGSDGVIIIIQKFVNLVNEERT
jgi:hypothetical protein